MGALSNHRPPLRSRVRHTHIFLNLPDQWEHLQPQQQQHYGIHLSRCRIVIVFALCLLAGWLSWNLRWLCLSETIPEPSKCKEMSRKTTWRERRSEVPWDEIDRLTARYVIMLKELPEDIAKEKRTSYFSLFDKIVASLRERETMLNRQVEEVEYIGKRTEELRSYLDKWEDEFGAVWKFTWKVFLGQGQRLMDELRSQKALIKGLSCELDDFAARQIRDKEISKDAMEERKRALLEWLRDEVQDEIGRAGIDRRLLVPKDQCLR
uniref:Uncharacterized protein n=1 Tax=Chromera velia CCMP2878 TaxID=1169474 RepID=A0A0G4GFD6_9ALVE|mmetsp:Transcript_8476/g.16513  ORF Transcript_8476/g.16513 Transcript_8476/m.16513 type:complete len:265 (+) Transcript_8476:386-1180(+)|eukprot:Cvel_21546.t1-p1 / transcript=Cvel_21546.t1 / gene=Cvel_21546 / organism=Chromera_velia_CCMP2878 / gene_product=hypothetical protein / transcript_product=hypothetical protein / location=Cvel_scaffold2031:16496-19938(+) / protein_length=264 / sequence_SO=supercontig / SO=protein_coding / is_pseudo=false